MTRRHLPKGAFEHRFKPGNRWWQMRSSHGVKPKFDNPEDLWDACCEFFEWTDSNPLMEAKLVTYMGDGRLKEIPKMRAMTIGGLCIFIDISVAQWNNWQRHGDDSYRPDLLAVIRSAEEVIRNQKFGGAAADLLNANIIARDLGLADKKEIGGPDGGPIDFTVTVPGVTDAIRDNPDNTASSD